MSVGVSLYDPVKGFLVINRIVDTCIATISVFDIFGSYVLFKNNGHELCIKDLISGNKQFINNTKKLVLNGLIDYPASKTSSVVKMITTTETGVIFWEIQGMNIMRIKDISMYKPTICNYNIDLCIILITTIVNNERKLFAVSLDGNSSIAINSTSILMDSKIYASDNLKNIAITSGSEIKIINI